MAESGGKAPLPYDERQATAWLAWLARGMQQHGQTVFLIEQLQPSWLDRRRQLTVYTVVSRLAVGLLLGLLWGLIAGSGTIFGFLHLPDAPGGESTMQWMARSGAGASVEALLGERPLAFLGVLGLAIVALGLLVGLVLGAGGTVLDLRRLRGGRLWSTAARVSPRWRGVVFSLLYFVGLMVLCALFAPLLFAPLWGLFILLTASPAEPLTVGDAVVMSLIAGIGGAAVLAPPFALMAVPLWGPRAARQRREAEIQPVETLSWSWAAAGKGLLLGLLAGLAVAGLLYIAPFFVGSLLIMLFLTAIGSVLGAAVNLVVRAGMRKAVRRGGAAGLGCGLVGVALMSALALAGGTTGLVLHLPWYVWGAGALVGGLAGIVFGGLRSRVVALKTRPNQGILLSLRNALAGGGLVALVFGAVGAAAAYALERWAMPTAGADPAFAPIYGVFFGVVSALGAALYAALWYGGVDVIYHAVVRLIIHRRGYLPLRLSRFLDYAAEELGFLQKVGGGYMFIHRYLLEHFAAMAVANTPPPSA